MTQRDLELKLKAQQDEKQTRYKPFRAVITDSAGNQTGTNSIWANEGERLVYYVAWGVSNVGQALCDRIEPVIGLGVYIQYTDYISQFEVIRDDPLQRGSAPNRRSYLYPTEQDIGRGGRHQLWVEAEMLQPLAVNPSTGLTVNIGPGLYDYFGTRKEYLGKSGLDISGSQPAGPMEHLYVGIYLDSSNTEQTINGATVASSTTAPEPAWPAGAFPLAVVDLDDAQTSIDLSADIENRKLLWSESIQDNLSATTAPTANEDSGDGYAERSLWIDTTNDKAYICVDATATAAVWIDVSAGGGGGGLPSSDEIINLNTGTSYSDFSTAVAATSADDVLLMGEGSFSEAAGVTISQNLTIIGQGREVSQVLFSSVSTGLTVSGGGVKVRLQALNILATNTGADVKALVLDNDGDVDAFECAFTAAGSGTGTAYGAYLDTTSTGGDLGARLCQFSGILASTANYGIYVANNSNNNCNLKQCDLTGATKSISIQNGQYSFSGDVFSGGGFEVIASTSEYGYYYYSTLTVWDGSAWVDMPTVTAWTTFTPTVTQSGSVTVTVTSARYKLVDDLCTMQVRLAVTGTGTAANAIIVGGIPAAAQPAVSGNDNVIGTFMALDTGIAHYAGAVVAVGASDFRFYNAGDGAYMGVSPAWALASGDSISFQASYEV